MKIVTIVQARTGSSRLPGKVMLDLLGKPLLYRQIERISSAVLSGEVWVATTYLPQDNDIVALCKKEGIYCYRGSPEDLLDRHYRCGIAAKADAVVKIPSDCPLIDPKAINRVIEHYILNSNRYDFVSNLHPPTYPDGNDVEVISTNALEIAWLEANKQFHREHTTPFIWDNPQRFKIGNVEWESGLDYSMSHRFTIDYPEDYRFIMAIYKELFDNNHCFSLEEILALLKEKPYIYKINEKYKGVNWYRHNLNELNTINAKQTKVI